MPFQEVLEEVVQLPGELLDVEGHLEARPALGAPRRFALQGDDLFHCRPVVLVPLGGARAAQRLLQGEVAEVLEHQDATRAVLVEDRGHGDPPAGQQVPQDGEGQMLRVERLEVQREDAGAFRAGQAVVPPGGRVSGERRDLHGPGRGTVAIGEEGSDTRIELGTQASSMK